MPSRHQLLRARLMPLARLLELRLLPFERRGDHGGLLLHDLVDCGLDVGDFARRRRQALELVLQRDNLLGKLFRPRLRILRGRFAGHKFGLSLGQERADVGQLRVLLRQRRIASRQLRVLLGQHLV